MPTTILPRHVYDDDDEADEAKWRKGGRSVDKEMLSESAALCKIDITLLRTLKRHSKLINTLFCIGPTIEMLYFCKCDGGLKK